MKLSFDSCKAQGAGVYEFITSGEFMNSAGDIITPHYSEIEPEGNPMFILIWKARSSGPGFLTFAGCTFSGSQFCQALHDGVQKSQDNVSPGLAG